MEYNNLFLAQIFDMQDGNNQTTHISLLKKYRPSEEILHSIKQECTDNQMRYRLHTSKNLSIFLKFWGEDAYVYQYPKNDQSFSYIKILKGKIIQESFCGRKKTYLPQDIIRMDTSFERYEFHSLSEWSVTMHIEFIQENKPFNVKNSFFPN